MKQMYSSTKIRLFLTSIFAVLFLFSNSNAQVNVQIGSGTTTSTVYPINSCYGYNYSQQIYTAAEITAGGGGSGEISSLRFFYASGGTTIANWQNWVVYLGNTTQTDLASTSAWIPLASLTQVFNGVVTPVAGNWFQITFATPFTYTGDNLVVAVDENTPNFSCTAAFRSFTVTAASGPRAMMYRSDTVNPDPAAPPTASASSTTIRPQIQFSMCPTAPIVSNANICSGASATLNATSFASATIDWYDAPVAGNLLGTGASFGTGPLTTSTSFYATSTVAGCPVTSATEGIVTVSDVIVDVTPTNETCLGIGNGTFSVSSVTCGTAPFTYSVDGGPFLPSPPSLTSGTYSVVVKDNGGLDSAPISVTIGANASITPNAPSATTPISECAGVPSIPLTATVNPFTYTYTMNLFDSFGDGWSGNALNVFVNGVQVATMTFTTGAFASQTFTVEEGDVITSTWTTGSFVSECSFQLLNQNATVIHSGVSTNMINYTVPGSAYTLNWYDAPGGTLLGTGGTLEAVGTSLMPAANLGSYDFYVTQSNGCESTPVQVTVNINEVTVDLAIVDESCTNYGNGTFSISNVDCGAAPFEFSVDGGAFGPVPTDLTAGTYTVVVQDDLGGQSAPISITVGTTSSVVPNSPQVVTPVNACSGTPSIALSATESPITATYTFNLFDSFGDGWNGNVLNVLINGVQVESFTFTTGSFASETLVVEEGDVITTTWTTGSFVAECSFDLVDENANIIHSGNSTSMVNYTVPSSSYTLQWYDIPGGTLLGTGNTLEAVGSSVMPTASNGFYDFYVIQSNGCESVPAVITVNVADVYVDLIAFDESCTNYANGTFSISNVYCGDAPYTFSVDGGAFGTAPTDLTAGTYVVIVQDNNGNFSSPMDLTVSTVSTEIPNTPSALDTLIYACLNEPSIEIEADGNTYAVASLLTTMAAGNGSSANMFSITATTNTTITEFAINADPGTGNYEIYYRPDDYLLTPGSNTNAAGWILVGSANGVVSAAGTYTPLPIPVGVTIPAGLTYSFHVAQVTGPGVAYTDGTVLGAPFVNDANITFNQGHGGTLFACDFSPRVFNGLISYESTTPANVEWFDSPSYLGVNQGSGSPFETIGTAVLPSSANAGSYEFYAFSELNGCYSVDPVLVTVNINDVNVELNPIDASCNNQANGSFAISNVLCGDAPFTFSVDGGTFGPAPVNLLPGVYEIVVQDNDGDLSASYFLTVGQAAAPSDLYMETITDDGGQVSWISNGTEVEWYVEWGLPGFIPGTGNELGAAIASDTFYIVTGLNDNTNYDVYVAANCGPAEVVGDWTLINFTTECGIYAVPFIETFEDDSETRVCWKNEQEVGTTDWSYQTGSSGGAVTTAYEGVLNARFVSEPSLGTPVTKLVSPRFDFTGQDSVALVFAYAQENWFGDQNITKVYVASQTSPWTEIQSYNNNIAQWTVDTLFLSDTVFQVAFEGTNNFGHANVIDDVQFLPCTLVPGTDGAVDACRLDNTVDLNSVIVRGETFGKWFFQNQTFIVDDTIADISLLPAGTYEFFYIVETPCAADTTVATITVFGPSLAGNDGVINVCRNEPFDLLSGLSGTVDIGGTWYDPSNNAIPSSAIFASNIPGQFNYDYVTSNGVCPADTANVIVNVSPSCDWLSIEEVEFASMDIFPNPTTSVVYITNEGSSEVFSYELTDLNGKVIASRADAINGTETTEIDLGRLEPGVYLIKVANENREHTFRVIKQ
jgi:hypothetical protein